MAVEKLLLLSAIGPEVLYLKIIELFKFVACPFEKSF